MTRKRIPATLARRSLLAGFAIGLVLGWTSEAHAYRPFDGTDAAVADPGEVEVEFQPAGAQWGPEQNVLIAPATVFNHGLPQDWEAVLEGQLQTPLFAIRPNKSDRIGSLAQTRYSAGLTSGSVRSEHRHRIRCSPA
jgi:hypothetical protein